MDAVKECDRLLAESDLLCDWVRRLKSSDKLFIQAETFSFLLLILLEFAEQDEQINELKSDSRMLYPLVKQAEEIVGRSDKVEREIIEAQTNIMKLREIEEMEERNVREEQMKRLAAKEKELYAVSHSFIKEKLDDIVPLKHVNKIPSGQVRRSRCRSLSTAVVRVVRKAGAAVRRSLSRGLRLRVRPSKTKKL